MTLNVNARREITCIVCGKRKEHHAKEMCQKCYKQQWKPKKKIICKNCKKEKYHHAFGLCKNCHTKSYHYDKTKEYNYRKWHNINLETYRRLTKKCIICGFDKVVELHHIDGNHKNNKESNLIGLCPNHHKMYHNKQYRKEIEDLLKDRLNPKTA